MLKQRSVLAEIVLLGVLFISLAFISYYHLEQSISITKYSFSWRVGQLLQGYDQYHHSLAEFIFQKSAFHPGNGASQWQAGLFLFPLFLFCDFLG